MRNLHLSCLVPSFFRLAVAAVLLLLFYSCSRSCASKTGEKKSRSLPTPAFLDTGLFLSACHGMYSLIIFFLLFRLLSRLNCLFPGMHSQCHSDNAIGYEYTEILTDDRIAEQLLTSQRRYDKQCMEQDNTQQSLLIGSLLYRSASYQKSCNRKLSHLSMSAVGGQGSHILQEDQLSPARQYR